MSVKQQKINRQICTNTDINYHILILLELKKVPKKQHELIGDLNVFSNMCRMQRYESILHRCFSITFNEHMCQNNSVSPENKTN